LIVDNVDFRQVHTPIAPKEGYCGSKNFAKNGDAETGNTQKWKNVFGNTLEAVTPGYGDESKYAFKASDRPMWFSGMFQFIEHGCMEVGSKMRFRAKFRLYDQTTGAGITTCNPKTTVGRLCPFIYLRTTKPKEDGTGDKDHYHHIQGFDMEWNPDGWNILNQIVEIDEKLGGPTVKGAAIFFLGGPANSVLMVDDILVEYLDPWEIPTASPTGTATPTSAPTEYCDRNWAGNSIGDFEGGSKHGFFGFGGEMDLVTPGYGGSNYAARLYNRPPLWGFGAFLWVIDHSCVEESSTWHFSFQAKLYDSNTGKAVTNCSPHTTQGTDFVMNCPYVRLVTRHGRFNDPNMIFDYTGGWSYFSVDYTLSDKLWGPHLELFWPVITGGPANSTLEFDNLIVRKIKQNELTTVVPSLTPVPSSSPTSFCTKNFIRNGDGEFGAPSYWMAWGDNYITTEEPGFGGIGYALKVFDRTEWNEGISQVISHACLEAGSVWRFQAQFKLYDQTTMQGIHCDPKSTTSFDCPFVRLAVRKWKEYVFVSLQDHKMEWDPDGWNKFDVVHTMEERHSGGHVDWFMPIFVGGPANSVLLVDNIIIEALEEWETPTGSPTISSVPTIAPTYQCDNEFVRNPSFDSGETDYWNGWGNSIDTISPGYGGTGHAIIAYDREKWHRGVGYWMDPGCLTLNSIWQFKFKVRLYDQETGTGLTSCIPRNELSNYCPMIRLITSKGDNKINYHHYRDTNMVWNPEGWSDFDLIIKMTPENSGDDVDRFFPYFVGGPAGSVLSLDDVSITKLDDDYEIETTDAQPETKTCMSVGDPHIKAFNGTAFDIHSLGWHLLYERKGVKIETFHTPIKPTSTMASNGGWRMSVNDVIVGEGGADGYVPPDNGVLYIVDPFTIYISVHTWRPSDGSSWYNIFITTSWYGDATGLCADEEVVADVLELPEDEQVTVDQAMAQKICANAGLLDMGDIFQFDNCVADGMLMNNLDFAGAAAASFVEVSAIETDIQQTIEMTDKIENTAGVEKEEQFLAEAVPLVVIEDRLKQQRLNGRDDLFLDLSHGADGAQLAQAAVLEPEVEREGDAMTDAQSGVNGDPLIMGLQRQVFNFDGKHDAWYVNLANSAVQWNMKFHEYPHCPADDRMYVTSMGVSLNRTVRSSLWGGNPETKFHNILLSIKNESEAFPGCSMNNDGVYGACLGDGSLIIDVDGFVIDKPGDYRISPDLRIVTHNTWNACSRRWFDYDKGAQIRDPDTGLIRKLFGGDAKKKKKNRRLDRTPIDYVRHAREHMVAPLVCQDWIERRASNSDLFQQVGGWTTIYIETPMISFHVEYRQISKPSGGGSGLPQDIVVNGVLFPGTKSTCISHVLDAWLTHISPEVKKEQWDGILGETRSIKMDEDGTPIRENRNIILQGSDVDYEVTGPFDRNFSAKSFNLEIQRMLEKRKRLQQEQKRKLKKKRKTI